MSAKDIAVSTLAAEPCRTLLRGLEFLPFGRRILNRIIRPRGVFATFEEAWSAARCSTYAGHDHPDYIKTHLEFSESLRPSDYAVLYWMSRLCLSDLHIFDFGGNVGNLYYSYSIYLKGQSRIVDWTVFDLPRTIEEGRRIASERGARELRFTNSLENCSPSHILLISGAFHYWEKSVKAFLEQFPHQPQHIILNRTPVHETQPSFITVQYKKTYAVPCVVRNTANMLEAFDAMGYTMADRWPALELALRMPLYPDRTVPNYSGFYFRHREMKANTSWGADRPAA